MKRKKKQILLMVFAFILIFTLVAPYLISAEEVQQPEIKSDAAFLYNLDTKEELLAKEVEEKFPIYNLTTLMTTYILIKDIEEGKVKLSDSAEISKKSWSSSSPKMFLEIGKKVTVEELLKGLIIVSGNDAAITTAEKLSGSTEEFVKRMNEEATNLGMGNTKFSSPNGTREDISTAKDLFKLAKKIIEEYPGYLKYFTQKEMKYETRPGNVVKLSNQNSYIFDNPNAKGLKNGWGQGQYHSIYYIEKNGMELLAVTLNTNTSKKRTEDLNKIMNFGFQQYTSINIGKVGEKYADFPVYKSVSPMPSEVIYKDDIDVVVRVGVTLENLDIKYEGKDYLLGGTKSGDELGKIKVYHNDKFLTEGAIVATESLEKGSFFNSFLDSIALAFRGLLNIVSDIFG